MKLQLWAADVFRFAVTGTEPHLFLNRAAAAGVHLRRVRWQKDGCTATAGGADRRRLEQLAEDYRRFTAWPEAADALHADAAKEKNLTLNIKEEIGL